jgi:hypothetical protein
MLDVEKKRESILASNNPARRMARNVSSKEITP